MEKQKVKKPGLYELMDRATASRIKNSPWFGIIQPLEKPMTGYDHNDPHDIVSQDDLDTMRDPDDPTYWKPSLQDIMEYENRSGWTPEDWRKWRQQREVMEQKRFGQ